ncbi:hypothetical protein DFH08DRAFT_48273 [Mycena albidolilacea]|uniref:CFEM domain-containing protein n=1 Tax=Mycena albidolilacea TaxID=1033008 RepID=A0AAD7EVT8_9AGAR|nr:hypothetical protein DFH08DRAFT_48273 [Mycena albidolilacea]
MAMRLGLFMALTTSLFLVSIPSSTAQDSGGLSPDQQCLLNCSLTAVTASGCDLQDTPCICGSSVYASNVTQCAESTCSVPASVVTGFLADGCADDSSASASSTPSGAAGSPSSSAGPPPSGIPSGAGSSSATAGSSASNTLSGSAAASSESGKTIPNSAPAGFSAVRTGVAAASAIGLVFYALLV